MVEWRALIEARPGQPAPARQRDEIRPAKRLADPRSLTDADASKLMAEGKPIYYITGSIHSPETGSPEMLMELAYRLAVEDTPFIQKIRKGSIVHIPPGVVHSAKGRVRVLVVGIPDIADDDMFFP